jgi:hypothetical protein
VSRRFTTVQRLRRGSAWAASIIAIATLAGCTYPGDTSGFKAESKLSKAAINQKIADVQNNPKIPANVRAMALKQLNEQLKTAQ